MTSWNAGARRIKGYDAARDHRQALLALLPRRRHRRGQAVGRAGHGARARARRGRRLARAQGRHALLGARGGHRAARRGRPAARLRQGHAGPDAAAARPRRSKWPRAQRAATSSRCWRTSCAIRWRRSATRRSCWRRDRPAPRTSRSRAARSTGRARSSRASSTTCSTSAASRAAPSASSRSASTCATSWRARSRRRARESTARGHQLSIDLPPEPVFLQGDELRLTQALTNVLNNAARYTDPGGKISLALRRESPTGTTRRPGSAGLERAFGPRHRARHRAGVHGQHLRHVRAGPPCAPAARRAASAWGSRWRAPSSSCTTAPSRRKARARARAASSSSSCRWRRRTPAAAAEQPKRPANGLPGRPRRVLVVDDNVDAATMLAALIRQLGHEVLIVHDGSAALRGRRRLPAGSHPARHRHAGNERLRGGAAAARARVAVRQPRIVAVTGWGKPEDRERSREAGFDMHLMKPVELSEIQRALLLNGASSTKH